MKKTVFYYFLPAFIIISCSKKDNSSNPIEPPITIYMTMTPNSNWNYQNTDNVAGTTSSYTLTSTSRDSSINGKTYHVYTNSGNNGSEYYNITNAAEYSTFRELPTASGNGKFEILYLKADVIGATWSQSFNIIISSVPVTVTVNNKIVEGAISRTVNNIAYTNVYHVQSSFSVTGLPSTVFSSNSIDSYYAPKVGLIENSTVVNSSTLGINVNTQTKLKTSTIL